MYSGIADQYPDLFEKITYYEGFTPKVGDIISYRGSNKAYGHVAIVTSVNGIKYTIIEQWKGSGTVQTDEVTVTGDPDSKKGIYGVVRPKVFE